MNNYFHWSNLSSYCLFKFFFRRQFTEKYVDFIRNLTCASRPVDHHNRPMNTNWAWLDFTNELADFIDQILNTIGVYLVFNSRNNRTLVFFKKMGQPRLLLFIFVLFKHKFNRKNCRRQRDSNLDRWSRRQAHWPLDHPHGPPDSSLSQKLKR